MKRFLLFIFLSSSIIITQNVFAKKQKKHDKPNKINKKSVLSAITYNLNGGRFGDNLLSYCKTKWLAEKYNIPFFYKRFEYSHYLALHKKEKRYTRGTPVLFKAIRYLVGKQVNKLQLNSALLYVKKWDYDVQVDWKNEKFIKKLRTLIRPSIHLNLVNLAKNNISIAVHVRRGGGYRVDTKKLMISQPLRFVADQFYVDQIKRIATMFEGKKIYVHIFTDDQNPEVIMENFKKAVNMEKITFGCRRSKNNYYTHVLEDFFAMMKFDCLIRPNSHYSRFVERLGDNKIIISPVHVSEENGEKIIDTIRIRQLTENGWKIKKIKNYNL
ncbi:MAG: hypothetical protein WCD44_04270 [Candidatus Babeliales bacterium]